MPICISTRNGEVVHAIDRAPHAPRHRSLAGKDPAWNERRESARALKRHLRALHRVVQAPASRLELVSMKRMAHLRDENTPAHSDVVSHLMQVVTRAERRARAKALRARLAKKTSVSEQAAA